MTDNYFEEISREATAEEISLLQSAGIKSRKHLPLLGAILLILPVAIPTVYVLLYPDSDMALNQASHKSPLIAAILFSGLILFLLAKFIWPNFLEPEKSPSYLVSEKTFRPLRVLQLTESGRVYFLMELLKDEWLLLHETTFPTVDAKTLIQQKIVLISHPKMPLTCEGYGQSVPFVSQENPFDWELPPCSDQIRFKGTYDWKLPTPGEVASLPELDAWFNARI